MINFSGQRQNTQIYKQYTTKHSQLQSPAESTSKAPENPITFKKNLLPSPHVVHFLFIEKILKVSSNIAYTKCQIVSPCEMELIHALKNMKHNSFMPIF